MKQLLVSLCILLSLQSCSQSKEKTNSVDDVGSIEMLKAFYTEYITENAIDETDRMKVEALEKKYSTKEFLNKIKKEKEDGELDENPYVYFQDFRKEWINTLTVTKNKNNQSNSYQVCFIESNMSHCLNILVKRENNVWKIDNVYLVGVNRQRKVD